MVVVVFGRIITSFVLSSLKQRHDIESWRVFAGTAFNSLATTVTGKHGIIQPQLHYQNRRSKAPLRRAFSFYGTEEPVAAADVPSISVGVSDREWYYS